jgi:hypothetical protein
MEHHVNGCFLEVEEILFDSGENCFVDAHHQENVEYLSNFSVTAIWNFFPQPIINALCC